MDELARAETVNVQLGEPALNVGQQIKIPLQRELGVVAALHENLRAAQREGFLDLLIHLLVSDDVGVGLLLRSVECAELAVNVADVGVVHVAVDDVGDNVVAASLIC
jgi:hypothetical protein